MSYSSMVPGNLQSQLEIMSTGQIYYQRDCGNHLSLYAEGMITSGAAVT